MTTIIITPDQDAIVSEIQIAAPPARVFQALTTAGELQRWFSLSGVPRQILGDGRAPRRPLPLRHQKGSIVVNGVREFECHGEILEYDPPRLLVYTWIANWHDDVSRRNRSALGTHAQARRHARESHAQRPRHHARRPQRLQRRLARRSRDAEEVRREVCREINQKGALL